MADSLSLITTGLAKGFQDGVFGIFKIYNLDKERITRTPTVVREPRSTLARRRFEMMKDEERSRPVETRTEARVVPRILRCCAWNGGIFWLSIIIFNNLLMPFLQYFIEAVFQGYANHNIIWSNIGPIVSWTFSALWVLPLFLLSKVVNGIWFQDIADAAYRRTRGRPILIHSMSKMIADVLFTLLLQGLFLIQGTLALSLPIRGIGDLVSLLHFSLLYSVYAFEYKWFNMGWEVHKRLSYVETNWPYFVGFGLPLAVLTALQSSYVMSGCAFSLLFPLFIISANEAEFISDLQCPFPLRLFSPVIKITNVICTKIIASKTASVPAGSQGTRTGDSASPAKNLSSRSSAHDSPSSRTRSRDFS